MSVQVRIEGACGSCGKGWRYELEPILVEVLTEGLAPSPAIDGAAAAPVPGSAEWNDQLSTRTVLRDRHQGESGDLDEACELLERISASLALLTHGEERPGADATAASNQYGRWLRDVDRFLGWENAEPVRGWALRKYGADGLGKGVPR